MNPGVRVLLKNILVPEGNEFKNMYIYIDNDKIADLGEELPVEYEFAELVLNYNTEYLAFPGFSVLVSLTDRYANIYETYSIDKKEIVKAALYELIMNGITLPVIMDSDTPIIKHVLKEVEFPAILIEDYVKEDQRNVYLSGVRRDEGILIGDTLFGWSEICRPDHIDDNCKLLDLRGLHTYNVSALLNMSSKNSMDVVLDVLWRPYKALGLGDKKLAKGSRADIVLYKISESPKLVTPKNYMDLLRSGYNPDTVIVAGELFIDKNEPLILQAPRIKLW